LCLFGTVLIFGGGNRAVAAAFGILVAGKLALKVNNAHFEKLYPSHELKVDVDQVLNLLIPDV
jgi:hypothetical protein